MEKRNISRTEFVHPISFDRVDNEAEPHKNVSCQGLGVDISEGGLGLSTSHILEKGNVIRLLVPALGGKTALPVFSVIRWSEPVGTQFRVGLQFLS
jgi:hypothetical protein